MPQPFAQTIPAMPPLVRQVRWRILALLFFVTVLNFVDRQALAVLGNDITAASFSMTTPAAIASGVTVNINANGTVGLSQINGIAGGAAENEFRRKHVDNGLQGTPR